MFRELCFCCCLPFAEHVNNLGLAIYPSPVVGPYFFSHHFLAISFINTPKISGRPLPVQTSYTSQTQTPCGHHLSMAQPKPVSVPSPLYDVRKLVGVGIWSTIGMPFSSFPPPPPSRRNRAHLSPPARLVPTVWYVRRERAQCQLPRAVVRSRLLGLLQHQLKGILGKRG